MDEVLSDGVEAVTDAKSPAGVSRGIGPLDQSAEIRDLPLVAPAEEGPVGGVAKEATTLHFTAERNEYFREMESIS